jgi:hypothetical protein
VDVGPHPNSAGFAGWYTPGPDWPLPDTWFRRQPTNAALEREVQERLARWVARREATGRGEPTLTRTQLGDLIVRTRAAMENATPGDRALLQAQLDDMSHEYTQRTWLEEDKTNWPAEPAEQAAEAADEPAKM